MRNKIRILFIGEFTSSHAQSWIDLLNKYSDEFEIVGFNVPMAAWPQEVPFKLYGSNIKYRQLRKLSESIGRWKLKRLMRTFKPDIVHTFGAFPSSVFAKDILPQYQDSMKWIMQVRGGPDVYLNQFDPKKKALLQELFKKCDCLIADNELNYQIAEDLGLHPSKKFSFGFVPGAGGMDLNNFKDALKPSRALRQVLWTKAYEWNEAKGLCTLEGIKLALPKLPGVKFIFAALNDEVATWMNFLPDEMKSRIEVHGRLPRKQLLEIMKQSRVVMAPSILEGIPNALYEAMASQAVPIFSPLPAFKDKLVDRKNILYARNLYPQEIADALVEAFADDKKADEIAANNLEAVAKMANREVISTEIRALYQRMADRKG